MHFERIYIQENYRRNPGDDPFLYGNIGVSVFMNPGESMEEAEKYGQDYIQDFIQRNTQYPEHQHIEIRTIPDIQVGSGSETSLDELIYKSPDLKALKSFAIIAKGNATLWEVYSKRLKELSEQ